jgi:hypothetical protein
LRIGWLTLGCRRFPAQHRHHAHPIPKFGQLDIRCRDDAAKLEQRPRIIVRFDGLHDDSSVHLEQATPVCLDHGDPQVIAPIEHKMTEAEQSIGIPLRLNQRLRRLML